MSEEHKTINLYIPQKKLKDKNETEEDYINYITSMSRLVKLKYNEIDNIASMYNSKLTVVEKLLFTDTYKNNFNESKKLLIKEKFKNTEISKYFKDIESVDPIVTKNENIVNIKKTLDSYEKKLSRTNVAHINILAIENLASTAPHIKINSKTSSIFYKYKIFFVRHELEKVCKDFVKVIKSIFVR